MFNNNQIKNPLNFGEWDRILQGNIMILLESRYCFFLIMSFKIIYSIVMKLTKIKIHSAFTLYFFLFFMEWYLHFRKCPWVNAQTWTFIMHRMQYLDFRRTPNVR
ncbi:hypothetical protein AF332_17110 [Sporosarcina globispora]|uniref:Uncharacterized protein n=1 Tax=Sporosarcina globispora TaxID=1459 RepID=A0A0M0GEY8_SPOGL|nr:hypothetical protein AF332_17110 [Sporosarcina globispora]